VIVSITEIAEIAGSAGLASTARAAAVLREDAISLTTRHGQPGR
jgi:hypothetical protein